MRGVDVAVIRGGAVGMCSALELARQGPSVALLERGWSMVGIAVWHFTVLLPDKFAGGIHRSLRRCTGRGVGQRIRLAGTRTSDREPARALGSDLGAARLSDRACRVLRLGLSPGHLRVTSTPTVKPERERPPRAARTRSSVASRTCWTGMRAAAPGAGLPSDAGGSKGPQRRASDGPRPPGRLDQGSLR
jgi:hypothetical protein